MRVLAFTVALVLGAVITWLLTVHRVTEPEAGDREVQVSEAEAFGGERTPLDDTGGAAGRWSRAAQDEDALLDRTRPAPGEASRADEGPPDASRDGHD